MRILFLSLLLLTFTGDICVAGQKYAFLVGVGGYDEKQLKKLPYARADIIAFRSLLMDSGFPDGNVVMLVDDLAALPTGGPVGRYLPEHKKIRQELSILLPSLEPDDELVIGLAGHGVQFKGDDNPYFCPLDADLTDKSSLISLNWLYDQLNYNPATRKGCRARAKLLIVDACRKDPESSIRRNAGGPELASLTTPQLAEPPKGVVALFSCAEGQEALEHAPLKHGVFFYHVLEGLKGRADGDGDSNVTLDEMIAFTKAGTTSYVRQKLRAPQTPRQKGYYDGIWVLRTFDRPLPNSQPTKMAAHTFVLVGKFTTPANPQQATLNVTVDDERLSGDMQWRQADGTSHKILLSGSLVGEKFQLKTYYEGEHWSNWTGEFDRQARKFTGIFTAVSARAKSTSPGQYSFSDP